MKKRWIRLAFMCLTSLGFSQKSIPELLSQYNSESIPYIITESSAKSNTKILILNSRELIEYQTSHIKNALYMGYNNFDIDNVNQLIPNKEELLVVYCSIGVRSETIRRKT